MSTTATFSALSLSTAFNSNAATSYISLNWISDAGLSICNSRASGLVNIPYTDGVISMTMDLLVADSLSHDLVLGMDWFLFLRSTAPHVIVNFSSGPLDLHQPLPSRLAPNFGHTYGPLGPGISFGFALLDTLPIDTPYARWRCSSGWYAYGYLIAISTFERPVRAFKLLAREM
ncbi:hypothetical protein B0H14DRAFT_3472256 [Mycena olivaceomarginata]|nr:hypothetical protein B0H14DRAFT_3472256 [Mycena olivaceomarginata]